jgi:hypothetical protein
MNASAGLSGTQRETFTMRVVALTIVAAILLLGTTFATAQEERRDRGTKQEQEACTPDVYRLCSAEIPDEKRIVACLRHNRNKLSPACRKVFS